MKIISLFTGIGAFEEALKQNGTHFETIIAVDNGERYLDVPVEKITKMINKAKTNQSKNAIIQKLYDQTNKRNFVKETYMLNNPDFSGKWFEDVRFIDGKEYFGKVDVLVGGSPCQAFSTYGKKGGIEDARGTLFYEYIRMVDESKPKVFIYENVTGLLTIDGGKTFERSLELFENIGYNIKYKILNAADYNLPQLRRRVFVVGVRKDIKKVFEFPKPKKLSTKVSDYYLNTEIDAKYYLTEKGFKYVTNHSLNKGRAKYNSNIMNCQTATQQFNWTGEFKVEKAHQNIPRDGKVFISNDGLVARKLLPIETVKLMGFKNFKFPNDIPDVQKWRQSGNSIAVPVLREIFKEVNKII